MKDITVTLPIEKYNELMLKEDNKALEVLIDRLIKSAPNSHLEITVKPFNLKDFFIVFSKMHPKEYEVIKTIINNRKQ